MAVWGKPNAYFCLHGGMVGRKQNGSKCQNLLQFNLNKATPSNLLSISTLFQDYRASENVKCWWWLQSNNRVTVKLVQGVQWNPLIFKKTHLDPSILRLSTYLSCKIFVTIIRWPTFCTPRFEPILVSLNSQTVITHCS